MSRNRYTGVLFSLVLADILVSRTLPTTVTSRGSILYPLYVLFYLLHALTSVETHLILLASVDSNTNCDIPLLKRVTHSRTILAIVEAVNEPSTNELARIVFGSFKKRAEYELVHEQ